MRAHFYRPVIDTSGRLYAFVEVTVQGENGGPLGETIWLDAVGGTALSNPFTCSPAIIEFYLDNPRRVRLTLRIPGNTPLVLDGEDVFPDGREAVKTVAPVVIRGVPQPGRTVRMRPTGDAGWDDFVPYHQHNASTSVVLGTGAYSAAGSQGGLVMIGQQAGPTDGRGILDGVIVGFQARAHSDAMIVLGAQAVSEIAHALTRTNMVANPSFETDTTGWGFYLPDGAATATRETTGGVNGAAFYRLSITTASTIVGGGSYYNGNGLAGYTMPVSPGDALAAVGSVRTNSARSMQIGVEFRDSAGVLIPGTFFGPAVALAANTWTGLSVTGTAPANAATAAINFYTTSAVWAVGDTLDTDSGLLEKASVVRAYFDGDTADTPDLIYAWTGTAHASTSTLSERNIEVPGHEYGSGIGQGSVVAGRAIALGKGAVARGLTSIAVGNAALANKGEQVSVASASTTTAIGGVAVRGETNVTDGVAIGRNSSAVHASLLGKHVILGSGATAVSLPAVDPPGSDSVISWLPTQAPAIPGMLDVSGSAVLASATGTLSLFGEPVAAAKPSIAGDELQNVALGTLMKALVDLGLIVRGTTNQFVPGAPPGSGRIVDDPVHPTF